VPFAIECVGTETGISQGSLLWNRSYFATPDSSPAPQPSATLHLEWRRGFHGLQSDCVPSSVYTFLLFYPPDRRSQAEGAPFVIRNPRDYPQAGGSEWQRNS